MPVRPTMQFIVDFVHTLIDVPDSDLMSDQDIQDMLDLNRLDVYQKRLAVAETLSITGVNEHHDFSAPGYGFWEEGAVLQNGSTGEVLTADDENWLLGRWSFDDDQTASVVITGRTYNVYYAASKCATKQVQSMRADFNFTADGMNVQRIAQINDLKTLAKDLAAQSWAGGINTIKMVRKDLRSDFQCGF